MRHSLYLLPDESVEKHDLESIDRHLVCLSVDLFLSRLADSVDRSKKGRTSKLENHKEISGIVKPYYDSEILGDFYEIRDRDYF